jgi:hypothetical protein
MRGHRHHRLLDAIQVPVRDPGAVDLPEHPQHALAKREEIDVTARKRTGHRIRNELAVPLTHRSRIAQNLLEEW